MLRREHSNNMHPRTHTHTTYLYTHAYRCHWPAVASHPNSPSLLLGNYHLGYTLYMRLYPCQPSHFCCHGNPAPSDGAIGRDEWLTSVRPLGYTWWRGVYECLCFLCLCHSRHRDQSTAGTSNREKVEACSFGQDKRQNIVTSRTWVDDDNYLRLKADTVQMSRNCKCLSLKQKTCVTCALSTPGRSCSEHRRMIMDDYVAFKLSPLLSQHSWIMCCTLRWSFWSQHVLLSSPPFLAPRSSGAECAAARLVKSMAAISLGWINSISSLFHYWWIINPSDKYHCYMLLYTVHVNYWTGYLVLAYKGNRTWSHTWRRCFFPFLTC